MLVYNYLADDNSYTNTTEARLDPLETISQNQDVYLLPDNATFVPIPTFGQYEIPVWSGEAWTITPDYRGIPVWDTQGVAVTIEEIGQLPAGCTIVEPIITPTQKRFELELAISAYAERLRNGTLIVNNIPFYIDVEGISKLADVIGWLYANPNFYDMLGSVTTLTMTDTGVLTGVPAGIVSSKCRLILSPDITATVDTVTVVEGTVHYTFTEPIAAGSYTVTHIYRETYVNWVVSTNDTSGFYNVELTLEAAKAIKATASNFIQMCFNVQCAKKAEMIDLLDEDLTNYDVTAGWPSTTITL